MAHFRDGDPVGDTVARERPRSVLAYLDGTRLPVDRVAATRTNLQLRSSVYLRDNYFLITGIEWHAEGRVRASPDTESVGDSWKDLGKSRMRAVA